MSGFNKWFKQYWEGLKEYNVEPDEDMLWDTWQESKKQAIERTKDAAWRRWKDLIAGLV
jgi:hypothetical protein